jgi:osmoprotectant transport system substrate-binding protein
MVVIIAVEDDDRFFPIYNPSLNVRKEVIDEYPGIVDVFAPISARSWIAKPCGN